MIPSQSDQGLLKHSTSGDRIARKHCTLGEAQLLEDRRKLSSTALPVQLTRSPYPSLNDVFIIEAIADDLEQQLQARLSEDSDRPATPSAAFYPSDEPGESLAYHTLLADPDLHRNDCQDDDDDDDDDEEEFVYDPAQRHAPGATARDNARGGRGDHDDDDDDGEIDSDSDVLSPRVAVEAVASDLHDEDNRSTTTTNTTLTPRSTSFSSLLSDGSESGEQPQRASSRSRRKAADEQQRIMLPQVPRNSHRVSVTDIESRGMSTKVDPAALASALLTHQ